MKPTILYEDDDVLAVNKPAGLLVHGDGRATEDTLVDWVLHEYPDTVHVGESGRAQDGTVFPRPGIIHRLDRETSGVMLIAKNQESFMHLKSQFQHHEIKKEYHAFVYGEMKTDTGVIDRPIGRSAQDFRLWSAQRGAKGEMREAVTEYVVVMRSKGYTFVHVFPKTGRTHQIRVHFKAIHYPLVADSQYAPNRDNSLGFERLALHSYEVTFRKMDGSIQSVRAPYPEDFSLAYMIYCKSNVGVLDYYNYGRNK